MMHGAIYWPTLWRQYSAEKNMNGEIWNAQKASRGSHTDAIYAEFVISFKIHY